MQAIAMIEPHQRHDRTVLQEVIQTWLPLPEQNAMISEHDDMIIHAGESLLLTPGVLPQMVRW